MSEASASKNCTKDKHKVPIIKEPSLKNVNEIVSIFTNRKPKVKIMQVLCERVKKTKSKLQDLKVENESQTKHIRSELIKFAKKCPVTPMTRFLERDIRNKIKANNLEEKYSKFVEEVIQEVRQDFLYVTHSAGVYLKTKPICLEDRFKLRLEPYKYLGKTQNYETFLKTRKLLKCKWVLHYPLIRNILKQSVLSLPKHLFNLQLKIKEPMPVDEFNLKLHTHLKDCVQTFKLYYSKISNIIENSQTPALKEEVKVHYYSACTGILSVYMSKCIARTLEHVVKFTDPHELNTYLLFYVDLKDDVELTPTADQVIEIYKQFMVKIIETGKQFSVIETYFFKGFHKKKISMCITEDFFDKCVGKLTENIRKSYEPLRNYLDDLDIQFHSIYRDVNECKHTVYSDIIFETGYEKIVSYKSYLLKIFYIPRNEYFSIGKLILNKYVDSLTDGLKTLNNNIFSKLAAQHEWESNDICETFKIVSYRALKKPKTTEELIEIGKYMTWIKDDHLTVLEERVSDMIVDLAKLITLGPLTKKHIFLNSTAVNWSEKIVPIIETHANSFDTLKFEAEEYLQKVIEDVNTAMKNIYPLLDLLDNMDDILKVRQYLRDITLHMLKIKEIENQIKWINQEEVSLGFPKSTYVEFEELKNYVYPFYHLLKVTQQVQRYLSIWQDGQFDLLCFEQTKIKAQELEDSVLAIQKKYRNVLRQQEDNIKPKFKGTVDDPDILNWPAPLKLCGKAMQFINEFKPAVNVMKIMCNTSLKKRHWLEMSKIAGSDITPNAGTTLRKIMKIDFGNNLDQYEMISVGATKENELYEKLEKMKLEWTFINFSFSYFERYNLDILMQLEDVQEVVNEQFIKIVNMKGSVFVKPHESRVDDFHKKLLKINTMVAEMNNIQTNWTYLYPIFSRENPLRNTPKAERLYTEADKIFKTIIGNFKNAPNVIKTIENDEIFQEIICCKHKFEIIFEEVRKYIKTLKLYFPRFFFLSNNEIITILSTKLIDIDAHLKKCFSNIKKIVFDETKENITGVENAQHEYITFPTIISVDEVDEHTEVLFKKIENQLFSSVKKLIIESFKSYDATDLLKWISEWPNQIILVVTEIYWTNCITLAIKNNTFQNNIEQVVNVIQSLIAILKNSKMSSIIKLKAKLLITNLIHKKSVMFELKNGNVRDEFSFCWLGQMRYYLQTNSANCECFVKLLNSSICYGNELIDNSDRLIITPLTERCFRTLMGAYHLHLNGSPIGPAGSGKTETVKDLSKYLGIFCIVFTCSNDLDTKVIGEFLKGISACGAWLALDEFNRISIEVLSTIGQMILTLQLAVKSKVEKFILENTETYLNRNCFICITMNPGYPGRSLLPENLKVLFRPVAMMVPDSAMITEISLISFGFESASRLACKIVAMFNFMAEMFSFQNQYDFGIRTLKAVLMLCEKNKQAFPSADEDKIVLNGIKLIVLPKLIKDDENVFYEISSDLFPNVEDTALMNDVSLTQTIKKCVESGKFLLTEKLVLKICECHDFLKVRQGIIFVGNTNTGKSTTIKLLADVLSEQSESDIMYTIINPKTMALDQIYGFYDHNTHSWIDGVIPKYFRDFAKDLSRKRKWIIFDGPIDTQWIENSNSVLDDNKKLCLSSGEVILATDMMAFFCEVLNLNEASPATISRCGIIYMDNDTIGWRTHVQIWFRTFNKEWYNVHETQITELINWILPPCFKFLKTLDLIFPQVSQIHIVQNLMKLFKLFMNEAWGTGHKKEEELKCSVFWMQASFILSCAWALSAVLDATSKIIFDEFFKQLWKGQNESFPRPVTLDKIEISTPSDGLIIDHTFLYKMKGMWKSWADIIKTEKVVEHPYSSNILVPTSDSVKYTMLLNLFIKSKYPFMLTGPTGSGKTVIIQDYIINNLDKTYFNSNLISFTRSTSCNELQNLILSKLNKRKFGRYSSEKHKTSLFFIDDLNLPKPDNYNAYPTLELLRQHLDHNIWYDLSNKTKIFLDNVTFIASCNTSNKLCPRLLRHFSIFSTSHLTDENTMKIFSNIIVHKWKKNGFTGDISTIALQLMTVILEIYKTTKNHLKPALNNFLYVFNIWDISRIVQGICMLKKETVDANKKCLQKILIHEVSRVIGDRISNIDHQLWLFETTRKSVEEHFQETYDSIFETDAVNMCSVQKLMFFVSEVTNGGSSNYEEITCIETLYNVAKSCLDEYNKSHVIKMDLVLFELAIFNLIKICRILSITSSNAILIGLVGSGRKTLVKLACQMAKQSLFQPEFTNTYSFDMWRSHIQKVVIEAGCVSNHTVLLVDDSDVNEEYFFDDLDYILKSSDIESIFDLNQKQKILEMVRLSAQGGNRNVDISVSSIFLFFNKRCKENLHVMLCMNSKSVTLRKNLQYYPSIVKYSHIIYFDDWPDLALLNIAETWLNQIEIHGNNKNRIVNVSKCVHNESKNTYVDYGKFIGNCYVTSTSYLEFLKVFIKIITKKQHELSTTIQRYNVGLEKLRYAASQIEKMQISLAEFQPQLKDMTEKAVEMTKQIATETIEVEKASDLVKIDEKIANEQALAAQVLKLDCEADLAQAIPILEDAISALNTLKPSDITLVKSMKNPPDAIKLVMAAVCVIKDVKPDRIPDPSTGRKLIDYWSPSKRILGDMNFLQTLKDFDKDNIKPEIMVKIRKDYLPHKDFLPHVVAKASSAAEGLCKWIIAMDMYDKVAKEVAPKKEKLEKAEKEYGQTLAILNEKKEEVARIEEKLANLKNLLHEAKKKQQILQNEVDICNRKLQRAQTLIGGLGGEKERWTNVADKLQRYYECLPGDILLSSAIITYLSCFDADYRNAIILKWYDLIAENNITCSDKFDLVQVLGSDLQIENWQLNGLPVDNFFFENAIICHNSNRYVLFIDPQYLAQNWIKQTEKNNNLAVVKAKENFADTIKECIILGKPVLIENIEHSLDGCLNSILLNETYVENNTTVINFGGDTLKFNSNFRMYLTSHKLNLCYAPNVYNKVCLINFSITSTSLENHLLKIIMEIEKPEYKVLKSKLDLQSVELNEAQNRIEETILITLSESKTDILEDERALKTLDTSKNISMDIKNKQLTANSEKNNIIEYKCNFKTVAQHAVVIYFSVLNLYKVNFMYQYSLEWFFNIFTATLQNAEKSKCIQKRCTYLIKSFTYNLYSHVTRSMYVKDRFTLSLLFCVKLDLFYKKITLEEFNFLCKQEVSIAQNDIIKNPLEDHITDTNWNKICSLQFVHENFRGLCDSFATNSYNWKHILESIDLEILQLPQPWETKLTIFQKSIVLILLKPKYAMNILKSYVHAQMGEKYLTPIQFDINNAFLESYTLCPIIFLLSTSSDPLTALYKFAERKKFLHKLRVISLGHDQGNKADNLIITGKKEGLWICLQNCHLAVPWLSYLEKKFETIKFNDTHENFRLWLTSFPIDSFPIHLLQTSIKITNEAQMGLQQNLLKTYNTHPMTDSNFYAGCPGINEIFNRFLYGLAFLHAVLQERLNFGPLGWNIPYEFKESDFYTSVKHLQIFLNTHASDKPFETLFYIIGECTYGGRVSDDWDQKLLNTLLLTYFNPEIAKSHTYVFNNATYSYGLPFKNYYEDYINLIMKLPKSDSPEVFGLHKNTLEHKIASESLFLFKNINAVFDLNQHKNVSWNVELLFQINDIINKIPKKLEGDCVGDFKLILEREKDCYNKLIITMNSSLFDLLKAIQGDIIISDELENMALSISNLEVPKIWLKYSNSIITTLANFLGDFCIKFEYISNTFSKKDVACHWLAPLFRPHAFLAAVKQIHSRNFHLPLEKITFEFIIKDNDNLSDTLTEGVYIRGLILEGASWNKQYCKLQELSPNVLHDALPIVWIRPIDVHEYCEESKYVCPVYKTSERKGIISTSGHSSNYIFPILLTTDVDPSHWIKRGVALICQK